jgi:hypothetical protein
MKLLKLKKIESLLDLAILELKALKLYLWALIAAL